MKHASAGSPDDLNSVGAKLQELVLTQGISPLADRAGAAALQTSSVPRSGRPSRTRMSENDEKGAKTVTATMKSKMIDTLFMCGLYLSDAYLSM